MLSEKCTAEEQNNVGAHQRCVCHSSLIADWRLLCFSLAEGGQQEGNSSELMTMSHHTKNFPPCLSARQHTENLTINKEHVLQKLRIIDIRNKGLPEERNLISQSS